MEQPSMTEKEPRRPGRPRKKDPSVPVVFRLPKRVYDVYAREALKRGDSVNEVLRNVVLLHFSTLQNARDTI